MDFTFHPHLDVYGVAIALVIAYEYGIRMLAGRYAPVGRPPVATRQRVMFYSGIVFLVVSSTWPLHDIGEQRLYMFHMIEHMLITLVVPPLLLGGTPEWLMHAFVKPIIPLLKVITRPTLHVGLLQRLARLHSRAVGRGADADQRSLPLLRPRRAVRIGDSDVVAGDGSDSGDEDARTVREDGVSLPAVVWYRLFRHRS